MSCDQTTVLKLLVTGRQSLDAICRYVYGGKPAQVGSNRRKNVRKIVGCLIAAGHACRLEQPNSTLGNKGPATFLATASGKAFIAAGKTVKSGPKGPHNGVPRKSAGMRQRLWDAMRLKQKFTMGDIVELTHRAGDPEPVKVIDNLRKYLKGLCRAGVTRQLTARAAGFAPSSNGFLRFVLLCDLGPRAPLTGAKFVTDPNAPDSTAARIPYPKRTKP